MRKTSQIFTCGRSTRGNLCTGFLTNSISFVYSGTLVFAGTAHWCSGKRYLHEGPTAKSMLLTALYSAVKSPPEEPVEKRIRYIDDEGELRERYVNEKKFDAWITGNAALRPIGDTPRTEEVVVYRRVDENALYALVPTPIDIKAAVHNLIEAQEVEFGSYCNNLINVHALFHGKGLSVPPFGRTDKGKLPRNEYAFRLDARYECDFFARNVDGSCSAIGFFQLSLPGSKKASSFAKCVSAIVQDQGLQESGVKTILGVGLANPEDILRVSKNAGFSLAVARRSDNNFIEIPAQKRLNP